MAYYLLLDYVTLSWRATRFRTIALSTTEAELMTLVTCCCEIVWTRNLAIKLDFPHLKPTDVDENNT